MLTLLDEGDSFADFEIIHRRNMMNTVMTVQPSTIIYIPYFSIVERLTHEELQKVKKTSSNNLEDNEILEAYNENHEWANYKKLLIDNVFYSKQVKKYNQSSPSKRVLYPKGKIDVSKATAKTIKMVGVPSLIANRYTEIPSRDNFKKLPRIESISTLKLRASQTVKKRELEKLELAKSGSTVLPLLKINKKGSAIYL